MDLKWTAEDIPPQNGRVAVITGADSGLGFETSRALASHGANVILAVRDTEKGRQAMSQLVYEIPGASVSVQRLNLSSLDSIRAAAAELRADHPNIDLLIIIAAVMCAHRQTTIDGFEMQFGTNHLGHFALTGMLLDSMTRAPHSRVVVVGCSMFESRAIINFDDLQFERSYDYATAYGQSKLANLMFCYELQHRLAEIGARTIAVAAHPGIVNIGMRHRSPVLTHGPLFSQSAQMGALPILRAATDQRVKAGQYYGPGGFHERTGYPVKVLSSDQSHDASLRRHLWAVSEKLTGVKYPLLTSEYGNQ